MKNFLFISGSSRLCYTCPESTSMEECNSKMTRYNCSRIGSFHTMCARSCDWSKGLYTRECSMEHKCATKQDECKNRETNQDPGQKGQPECEYHCCLGNLCNNEPCSLGRNTRSQPKSIMGSAFLSLALNLIASFF